MNKYGLIDISQFSGRWHTSWESAENMIRNPDDPEHPSNRETPAHPADEWVCGSCGSKNIIRARLVAEGGSATGGGAITPGDKDGGGA